MAEKTYRPTLAQARQAMDRPLDPDLEFEASQKALSSAQESGKIEPLTSQERAFLSFSKMGLPWQHAARGAGMTGQQAQAFMDDPRCQLAAQYIAAAQAARIIVNKDLLTFQYYEAISEADTAGEKIRGLDSIAKLHQIGGFDTKQTQQEDPSKLVGNGLSVEAQKKKLSQMSTDKLMEAAALDADFYEPKKEVR